MDRSHQQYRGGLTLEKQAEVIATAHGPAGSNVEYLENTIKHLNELGVTDAELQRIYELTMALKAS